MRCDLLFINGNILTMDNNLSKASWVAVKNGRIAAIGSREEKVPQDVARVVDLKDQTMLPGLIDSHFHGTLTGVHLNSVDLSAASSVQEIIDLIAEECRSKDGEDWVYGAGLMPQYLKEGRAPTRWELDQVTGNHPVLIEYVTLHGNVANSKALKYINIPEDMPGVEKNESGEITGSFTSDESSFLVSAQVFGLLNEDQMAKFMKDSIMQAMTQGVTTVHSLDGQFVNKDKDVYLWLKLKDSLPIHMINYFQTRDVNLVKSLGLPRIGGCLTLDGAGFEHTMALFEPYNDLPDCTGVLYWTDEEVYQFVSAATKAGLQCAMHALGDRAIEQLVDAHLLVAKEQRKHGLRHRIEHFSLCLPHHIEAALELELVLAMQPIFTYLWDLPNEPNGGFYEVLYGRKRADAMDPFPELIKKGCMVCGGSDSPVTQINPLLGIHACVNNPNPKRRISIVDAIKMFTINGAWAANEEKEKGTIEEGKLADFVVLDKDPFVETDAIDKLTVEMTVVEGKIVYKKNNTSSV